MNYQVLRLWVCFVMVLASPSYAQPTDAISFPSPIGSSSDSFSNYASRNQPTWQDFADFVTHPIYGDIGRAVGRLHLTYEGEESYDLYDQGNCTATILSERLLITNAHCVYSPQYAQDAGEDVRLTNLALAMNAHASNERGDVYPVRIEPIEINPELDVAILEFAAASPFARYGAVDLSNHRSARVGEALFMIHHSNITGRFDGNNYKRITESNCTRLNRAQLTRGDIPIIMPDGRSSRPLDTQRDVPHFCDSERGSSGALVYARSDNAVVGLHFSGRNAAREADRFNLFIDIETLCQESRVLRRLCNGGTNSSQALISTSAQLVQRARQGGTLRLAAGTFELSETLELSGDVQLIGQGYEQTRIVSSAGFAAVRYRGGGTLRAQGIGFAHVGERAANILWVDDGGLDIHRCSFSGGKRVNNSRGNGIVITGNTQGTIRNSEAYANDLHGIEVSGNAQPRLESNRLHDNTQAGIRYGDSTAGSATNNESFGNGLHGIAVQGNAQPRLESNRLHDNTEAGIAYFDSAAGSATNNQSYNNRFNGIYIESTANPTLSGNQLYGNARGDLLDERGR